MNSSKTYHLTIKNYGVYSNVEEAVRQIHVDYINSRAVGSKTFNNLFKDFREYIEIFGETYWIANPKNSQAPLDKEDIILYAEELGINLEE